MRRWILVSSLAVAAVVGLGHAWGGDAVPAQQQSKQQATPAVASAIGGVHWYSDLAAARARAARTGKPVLELQLFGRLDERWC